MSTPFPFAFYQSVISFQQIKKFLTINICFQQSPFVFNNYRKHWNNLQIFSTIVIMFWSKWNKYNFTMLSKNELSENLGKKVVQNCENNCERREHPSQSYETPKKCNKILNIGCRTILYSTFSYSFSILNWFQTWTGPARPGPARPRR